MQKQDVIAILIMVLITISVPLVVYNNHSNRTDIIHARIPENGNWSKTTIYLKVNVPFTLSITSEDVVHSFIAPQFNISVKLIPGTLFKINIIPTETGNFQFYCDIICSPKHVQMVGLIVVSD